MSKPDVVVIDYGVGNLLSVRRGLEKCGATVSVTSNSDEILSASRVVLPGVGAFGVAMTELQRLGLDAVVLEIGTLGKPLLGICLGMQMLLDESDEFGKRAGLGLIPGQVIPLPATTIEGDTHKIPHIGWNSLEVAPGAESWDDTILRGLNRGEAVYFVHSYMADVKDTGHGVADCIYGGNRVSAVIARDNVIGCQFHPEKSGEVGLKVLRQFLSL